MSYNAEMYKTKLYINGLRAHSKKHKIDAEHMRVQQKAANDEAIRGQMADNHRKAMIAAKKDKKDKHDKHDKHDSPSWLSSLGLGGSRRKQHKQRAKKQRKQRTKKQRK